jgi:hypothetical protein
MSQASATPAQATVRVGIPAEPPALLALGRRGARSNRLSSWSCRGHQQCPLVFCQAGLVLPIETDPLAGLSIGYGVNVSSWISE